MPDIEGIAINKAEEIAVQRYGREFSDLPEGLQYRVWSAAEGEVVQAHLRGVWTRPLGCPHIHLGDIDRCDANEMRPCVFETDHDNPTCDIFREVLEEWRKEFEILIPPPTGPEE